MDFGAHLRQARESRGISLRDVSEETKISMVALEAMERNDIGRLPGGIFTRAFVRSYAAHVGLDAEQALQQFLQQFPDEAGEASLEPHGNSSESEPLGGLGGSRLVVWLILLAVPLAAGAMLLWGGGAWFSEGPSAASAQQEAPAPPATPAPILPRPPAPSAQPPDSAPPSADPADVPAVGLPVPPPAESAMTPSENAPLTVTVAPVGTCWVLVTVDGERRPGRVMQAGERDVIPVRDELVIDIGDAGAFAFSINGTMARSLGGSGQVVKLRLTPANYRTYLSGG